MSTNKQSQLNQLSKQIIGCAYTVANTLGPGFLEKVYENALVHELKLNGLNSKQQVPVKVMYKEIIAGEYIVDLLVEDLIIVELKAVKDFNEVHKAQCINYLKATGRKLCLLINFGKLRVEVKRIIQDF